MAETRAGIIGITVFEDDSEIIIVFIAISIPTLFSTESRRDSSFSYRFRASSSARSNDGWLGSCWSLSVTTSYHNECSTAPALPPRSLQDDDQRPQDSHHKESSYFPPTSVALFVLNISRQGLIQSDMTLFFGLFSALFTKHLYNGFPQRSHTFGSSYELSEAKCISPSASVWQFEQRAII